MGHLCGFCLEISCTVFKLELVDERGHDIMPEGQTGQEGGTQIWGSSLRRKAVPQASLTVRGSQEEWTARPALEDKGRVTKSLYWTIHRSWGFLQHLGAASGREGQVGGGRAWLVSHQAEVGRLARGHPILTNAILQHVTDPSQPRGLGSNTLFWPAGVLL